MPEPRPASDRASIGSAVRAILALPAMAAIAVPTAIALLDRERGDFAPWGLVVVAAGAMIVASTVRDFFAQGRGTLAPWDPPRELVRVGLFARCRNPMYLGVLTVIGGWSATLASWWIAGYGAAMAAVFHIRVVVHEEPWAARTFADQWPAYRTHVPRWLPRVRPWRG